MTDRRRTFTYRDGQAQRLDKYLVDQLGGISRNRIQTWIKDGRVLVDGQPVHKTGWALEAPARVEVAIPPQQPSRLEPEPISLDIVFEDANLLVVNKPAGMVVHPAAGHSHGTLVHAVLAHLPDIEGVGGVQRPGVVHRLDKNTSGLILLAKDDPTHQWLQERFRAREVEKTYLALVDGRPPTPTGRIEAAIGRSSAHRTRMAVVPPGKGREAVTAYRTLQGFASHTYLEVKPVTGRTHQIRVHLAFLGCPVAGDRDYGPRHPSLNLGRHFLHAWRLSLRLPGEKDPRTFEAPLPPELSGILEWLERGGPKPSP